MARKAPKNPINDIVDTVGAWFGGNRGSVPSSGAGAAWQASARSAAQSANRRIVKGVEEGVVQFGALGMGTSAQTQRDLMYGVSGAGTQALKEAAVSQVTGLAAGAVAGKVASKVIQSGRVVNPVAAARNLVKGEKVVIHGTPNKLQGKFIEPRAESWGAQELGKPVVYNFDPRAVKAKNTIPYKVQEYANPNLYFDPTKQSQFNAVIGRTPKSSVKTHSATGYRYSESPVSIDKVVKTNKSPEQLTVELQRELRKMGTQMRGTTPKQAVKDAIARRQIKKRPPQPRT